MAVHKVGKFLSVLFWLLFLAFVLLDGVVLGFVSPKLAGWEIFITGLVAWYIATATLVNTVSGKKVWPLA
jgi:succinate-acetate transporter protein